MGATIPQLIINSPYEERRERWKRVYLRSVSRLHRRSYEDPDHERWNRFPYRRKPNEFSPAVAIPLRTDSRYAFFSTLVGHRSGAGRVVLRP